MPDARTHDIITVLSGVALAPVSYSALISLGLTHEAALPCVTSIVVAHLISGILFSPDLDLDSAIDNRWGIFYWIWRPYMRLIPHRHFWSHGFVLAPLLRLLYFYLVVVLLLVGGSWLLAQGGIIVPSYHTQLREALLSLMQNHPAETWSFLAGFVTGSAVHTIADWAVTNGRRFLRSLGIRVSYQPRSHERWDSRGRYRY